MSSNKLDHMFDPKSVAVIGASRDPLKYGSLILKHMLEGGYEGKIYPVNPRGGEIQGLKTYPNVENVPGSIDLAIIATPAPVVSSIISECVEKGVETAVIISSGFGETGREGKKKEEELVSIARKNDLRFAGPNCMGIYSSQSNLRALMPPTVPMKGKISFVSQSGNLGVQMLDRTKSYGLGFDIYVSSGNEADLRCEDYIDYFRKRSSTEVAISYMESAEGGRRFLEMTKKATREKPLVVFKSGETEAGKSSALSHTGSMVGSKEAYDGVFRQAGIVRAETTDDLLNFASAFSQPIPKNNEVAIVTRGGGWGVVAADACNKYGIEVPQPPPDVTKKLDKLLPSYWSRGNPIDSVAERGPSVHERILDAVKGWDVGGVIVLGGIGEYWLKAGRDMAVVSEKIMSVCMEYVRKIVELSESGKAVFAVAFRPMDRSKPVELLRRNRIPVYSDPETVVKSYSKLIEYKKFLGK